MNRALSRLLLGATLLSLASPRDGHSQTGVMRDGFELGDLSSWSAIQGGPLPASPTAFRVSGLSLLDPHLFTEVLDFICADVTSELNEEIANQIVGDEDLDSLLDLSGLLLFRPLEQDLLGQTVDQRGGFCTTAPTSCSLDTWKPAHRFSYDNHSVGTCLEALANTTSGDTPVPATTAPCFVTDTQDATVDFGAGLAVPLLDVQFAGVWNGDPASHIHSGLLRGFLLESVADSIILPLDGMALSSHLAGGTDTCAAGDDRDVHEAQTGWWIYASFDATTVPWLGL